MVVRVKEVPVTVHGLQGQAIGVVLDAHRPPEVLRKVAIERFAVERRAVGVLDEPGAPRDRAGRCDADADARAELVLGAQHQVGYRPEDARIIGGRRRHPAAQQLPSSASAIASILMPPRSIPIAHPVLLRRHQ